MSATGRSDVRRADDFYETPAWCVERLLEEVEFFGGAWLEPAVGHGAIVRAISSAAISWTTIDTRDVWWQLADLGLDEREHAQFDFLDEAVTGHWDVAITNPPFSRAVEFAQKMLSVATHVALLTRLNLLEGGARAEFFRSEAPDVYVLPNRPSFTEDNRTDATAYCWLVWGPERGRSRGILRVLAPTTKEARR